MRCRVMHVMSADVSAVEMTGSSAATESLHTSPVTTLRVLSNS